MEKMRIGIMGCGKISDIYITNFMGMHSDVVELVAISSRHIERTRACAEKHGIPYAMEPDEFYASEEFDILVNLTVPKAHYEVNKRGLEAGKHVYTEKPLALNYEQGLELIALAKEKNLYLGGAPDTFFGAGVQTARHAIDSGEIGQPVSFTAFMMCHGWEIFHPNPDFYYAKGGGPMHDMGPYYLTALVNLLGPVEAVCAMDANPIPHREVVIGPRAGETLPIEVPTHVVGTVKFKNGAIGSIITTFDVWPIDLPYITVFGTKGTLVAPNPDLFSGPVQILDGESGAWHEVQFVNAYLQNSRGIGVRDMCLAIREKRPQRANANLMNHVLEVMDAFHKSSVSGKEIKIQSTVERPEAFCGQ